MIRHRKSKALKESVFLKSLSEGATVSKAAGSAEISTATAYNWRRQKQSFARQWDLAIESGTDRLEDEAFRRAIEGVEKPVFYGGKEVGFVRDYSDSLLVFMLKARRPEKFKDQKLDSMKNQDSEDQLAKDVDHAKETLISKLVQAAANSDPSSND